MNASAMKSSKRILSIEYSLMMLVAVKDGSRV